MFEQDYIMRLISEIVRTILKLLFNIDTNSPSAELIENHEEKETLKTLIDMVDNGNINKAENMIYDLAENDDLQNLKIALLFYSYLNEKDSNFLEENNFSRGEIKSGIYDLVSRYGLSSLIDPFISDM